MGKNDLIQRFLFDDTDIRGEIVYLEKSYQDAYRHQNFPISLTPLFGEFLAGAVLLSEVLKFKGVLTLQARGNGDVAIIMAETNHKGELRGIIHPRSDIDSKDVQLDDLRLPAILQEGVLTITIEPEKGKRYQGVVPITKNTLAECLENYFQLSEQLPSQIQLFASDKRCGGLLLQCLPAQLITNKEVREDMWETCTHLANTLRAEEIYELENEQVLANLFNELQCRIFKPKALQFKCSCDRQRSVNALRSLGFDDAMALLRERDIININCEFCGKIYTFGEKGLMEIFPIDHTPVH